MVNKISEDDAENLEVLPSVAEIKEVVWACDLSKALGSNDFNLNFIGWMWDTIGEDFQNLILEFFQNGSIPKKMNMTWVTLVSKFEGAKDIKDFRPISMVGCVYKVIAKILSRRLKGVMCGLVSEEQSTFAQGRKILDGALIAYEMVHWMKKNNKRGARIKLDFQKAYDSVKWNFVDLILERMGFGKK